MGHDLWFALRRIRLRPLHSAVIALTLALGLGASLAVFSVVDAVLLRPLPYEDPGQLIRITQTIPSPGLPELPFSDVGFRRLAGVRSLAAVAAYDTRDANLIGPDGARRLIVARVTATLFDVFRVVPSLGRGFTPEEDQTNGPRVLVLSDWLFRSAWNADPDIVGTVANLEGEPFTIVGVLPPSISFPARDVAAWEPLRIDPAEVNPYNLRFTVLGRLGDNVETRQAQAELTEAVRSVGRDYPGPHAGSVLDQAGYTAHLRSLAADTVGDARPVVVLLLAGVLMLLLLTCANVANLQLAGVIVRSEELAVRAALGATRGRLIRGALIEGIVLTGAGAVAGMVIAGVGAKLLATLLPPGVAVAGSLLGGRALVVAVVAVLLIGAAVGALPVAIVARRDPARGLKDRSAGASPAGASRMRRLLASAQVALAVLLLHGSGLLIASARQVQNISLGFETQSTLSLRINLPDATLRDRSSREVLLRRLVDDVSRLPGVVAVGLVNALPLTPGRQDLAMAVEGRPFKADGTDPLADYRVASAGYFAAMGIVLRRGRTFTDDDANATYTPLVISEGLARRLFPDGADPIGQRLRFGPAAPWMPIIGVVTDAKNRSLTDAPRPELYAPGLGTYATLAFRSEITLVVRARGEATSLTGPIRRAVAEAGPDVAMYAFASLEDIVREARATMTTATRLMTGYALAALLLAIAGTYAVLSYLVSQRRKELALRMALGATPRAIMALVARESAILIGAGIVAGLVGALASARLLTGLLYGVGALNAGVVLAVLVSASVAGVLAALVPARRATMVDPNATLRAGG
jgi:putative ABC transport system permease protein